MPELKLNGKTYSGSTNYASAIEYVEEDGSRTTVQDKIDEQNKNLNDLSKKIVDIESKLKNSATSQSGSLTITAMQNLASEYTVTFQETFNTIPTIIITSSNSYLACKVLTVTKGGFSFRCAHSKSSTQSGTASWNATADIAE